MCMHAHFLCVCLVHSRPEGAGSSLIRVTDGCEMQGGFKELNPGSLEEQSMLLPAEASLYSQLLLF